MIVDFGNIFFDNGLVLHKLHFTRMSLSLMKLPRKREASFQLFAHYSGKRTNTHTPKVVSQMALIFLPAFVTAATSAGAAR